jgi:1-deoxy-D-xylulose-5-phosphate reductoisomerase
MAPKRLSILGSTGSIGTQVLNVVRRHPDRFRVSVLTAHKNTELLARQIDEFKPDAVAVTDEKSYLISKSIFGKTPVFVGAEGLKQAASYKNADTVVAAVVGTDGFCGVYEAVRAGKKVALANKEALVSGGKLVMTLAKKTGAQILPVDSEHSAVFQSLQGQSQKNLRRIILTASGGAFYGKSLKDLEGITPERATRHPNWSMGKKITVDSSTMMNKGLEIIEARWLFDTQNIDYVIHPESIVHSMVEFCDGSVLAQLSYPNMEYPIQYALTYPERLATNLPFYAFDKPLNFLPPDEDVFILPGLCKAALAAHEGAPLVLNAVNEAAVALFLHKRIGFTHIFKLVRDALAKADFPSIDTPEAVIAAHNEWYARTMTEYN